MNTGLVRRVRCGKYLCTLTAERPTAPGIAHITAEWSPHAPARLAKADVAKFKRALDAAQAELGTEVAEAITDANLLVAFPVAEHVPTDTTIQ